MPALAAKENNGHVPVTDFSGFITKTVKGSLNTTEEAILKIRQGEAVHPRGTGHSSMGQGLREGAWIFTPPNHAPSFNPDTAILKISAGASLLDADEYLEKYGYMLPVSPDHRSLSIGGVLSVGGYGVESIRYGALVNYVTAMDILLPDGQAHYNVPAHLDIAHRVLEGLGEHGTILSASIQCIKNPRGYYLNHIQYRSYGDYVNAVIAIQAEPDTLPALDIAFCSWYRGRGMITTGYFADQKNALKQSGVLDSYRFIDDIRMVRQNAVLSFCYNDRAKYYVWSDHWISPEQYASQAWDTFRTVNSLTALGANVALYSYPTNLGLFKPPKGNMGTRALSMGIYSNFPADSMENVKKATALHLEHSARNAERGGLPYKHGWFDQKAFSASALKPSSGPGALRQHA